MAKETMPIDIMTPLQAYAYQAHELYTAFQDAGFGENEAWALLANHLPDFEIPIYVNSIDMDELTDMEEDEDGNDEETNEEDQQSRCLRKG